jgi:hypothetical protein
MWPVMFPTAYVDKNFIDTRDWIVQIATLFGVNETDQIKSQLNRLKFSGNEIDSILLLKSLKTLKPESVFDISKKRDIVKLDKKIILEFAKLNKLDIKMIKAFIKYRPSTNGGDVMKQFGVKGPAIADKIKEIEAEKFAKLYK